MNPRARSVYFSASIFYLSSPSLGRAWGTQKRSHASGGGPLGRRSLTANVWTALASDKASLGGQVRHFSEPDQRREQSDERHEQDPRCGDQQCCPDAYRLAQHSSSKRSQNGRRSRSSLE